MCTELFLILLIYRSILGNTFVTVVIIDICRFLGCEDGQNNTRKREKVDITSKEQGIRFSSSVCPRVITPGGIDIWYEACERLLVKTISLNISHLGAVL
jgi:hypothetical protein